MGSATVIEKELRQGMHGYTPVFVLLEGRKLPLMMPRRLWEDPGPAAYRGLAGRAEVAPEPSLCPQHSEDTNSSSLLSKPASITLSVWKAGNALLGLSDVQTASRHLLEAA